ncbi:LOW QUALITY PROTEIN: protein TIFY 3A [Arabidopsis lyrata subsp. lyrata]|uniref:LOW QUALITY PROTEIN: protein TIFY 3A n=1 Tax=Arabidopsis lyrata subsp. lyrata TaxID=81972 RepID=UPI000A29CA9F|nr:LOW QUALITY PROTEIN: protein TIFY 3A [Arabidopsis lyrata subsp. lyrata]|eukprot:XP_020882521.1 LOW QUALITY PROTEIN: protein TIFY 3A [Arabidopsis lyrata subsp. lyrata]
MAEVTEKPRACVEARDGDFLLPSFSADGTGSVSPGVDLSVEIEKPIHEARSTEPDASTIIPTQLTIISGGSWRMFDGVPAQKVQEIIHIAAAAKEIKNVTGINPALNRVVSFSGTTTVADLPIARRRSLQRFLEKRRDRSTKPDASTILPSQLTIIFGGSFSVFDGIPAEKVQEILRIAAAAKATETKNLTSINPALKRVISFSSTSTIALPGAYISTADVPIARRRSLQRFLEKRRDRFVHTNPYSATTSKAEKTMVT